ncbi:NAD(P)/FAD-dependent oxidoreductase [Microbacterium sp. AGC85]
MTTKVERVVIVGGGAGGINTARALRAESFTGAITVVADEAGVAYDRPPLSKDYLVGSRKRSDIALESAAERETLGLDWREGCSAIDADLRNRRLTTSDGEEIAFDELVIATGVRPRAPRGLIPPGARGVHVLRTAGDADDLRSSLTNAHAIAIIGAGFIGTELAATARALGLEVHLIDPLPRPLGRVLTPTAALWLARRHQEAGVQLAMGVSLAGIVTAADSSVQGVLLDDGTRVGVDVVVLALGAAPDVRWLKGTGLDLSDGIRCDAQLRAATHVRAVGDIARAPRPGSDTAIRVEHRLNATEQGQFVGSAIAHGHDDAYDALPYFWSDQLGSRIQGYGTPRADDDEVVLLHDDHRLVVAHGRKGRLVSVVGVGAHRELRQAATLLREGTRWDEVSDAFCRAGA